MGKIRGTHSSPGVYTQFTDLSYAAKTLGITTLGVVGETVKGPAFEPIMISNYSEYQTYFGGTNAEKYKDSQYPRYQLPYIAKEYLKTSDQLYVCRVLGLSGYNAGPAWVITASGKDNEKYVIAVLRSRGDYKKYVFMGDACDAPAKYDQLQFECSTVELEPYTNIAVTVKCDSVDTLTAMNTGYPCNALSYGQFTIVAKDKNGDTLGRYPVSLNAGTKDYIYNVLGSKATEGEAALFVEELYDVRLAELVEKGKVENIDAEVIKYNELQISAVSDPVRDFVNIPLSELKRKYVGQTFVCAEEGNLGNDDNYNGYGYYVYDAKTGKVAGEPVPMKVGGIYTVTSRINEKTGAREYIYVALRDDKDNEITVGKIKKNEDTTPTQTLINCTDTEKYKYAADNVTINNGAPYNNGKITFGFAEGTVISASLGKYYAAVLEVEVDKLDYKYTKITVTIQAAAAIKEGTIYIYNPDGADAPDTNTVDAVNVLAYDSFVALNEDEKSLITLDDKSDYHEQYRCASTPWIVSELKGDGKDLQVKKLFRFHTISDGSDSNTEVKVSITNVRPEEGLFDVYVRDFNDTDANVTVLETYRNLTMVPGDSKYIGLQIGTLDGAYETKSKYIVVEVIENDMTKTCVPCGFLGYPVRDYTDKNLEAPSFTYNTNYDDEIKIKKQYFGISDITGIDSDILSYKGKNAYTDEYTHGYTSPFHLDSTLSDEVRKNLTDVTITIDGDMATNGISWQAVSPSNVTDEGIVPIIGTESDMYGTIYEDKGLRKFTVCFYGGFDGWDIYRDCRTNTDEFRANKYKGDITNGHGQTFSKIQDVTSLALEGNCITSDYYAFLSGVNQFEQPEKYIINLFATPGIDYVNNTALVDQVLDMLEEKRKDTFYVVDTPDKPWGASDAINEMYSAADAVENLESVGIDTYYAATYYPWVKYYDSENNVYVNLPATKDALKMMSDVDNKKYPWYAPAGITRGTVDCEKMHFFAKLEDEDTLYDGRINPLKTFSQDGVKIWGNKTMYSADTPMNRINVVRLMLYMRKLIIEATRVLLFEPNDTTLKAEFESIVNPILAQIKKDRGITAYRLDVEQTAEMMDAHEIQCKLWVKPTPTLEYIEINFMVTPQGVEFDEV